jgi:hypothetical protein
MQPVLSEQEEERRRRERRRGEEKKKEERRANSKNLFEFQECSGTNGTTGSRTNQTGRRHVATSSAQWRYVWRAMIASGPVLGGSGTLSPTTREPFKCLDHA